MFQSILPLMKTGSSYLSSSKLSVVPLLIASVVISAVPVNAEVNAKSQNALVARMEAARKLLPAQSDTSWSEDGLVAMQRPTPTPYPPFRNMPTFRNSGPTRPSFPNF